MTREDAETLLEYVAAARSMLREEALRSALRFAGIGDDALDRAIAALEREARGAPT